MTDTSPSSDPSRLGTVTLQVAGVLVSLVATFIGLLAVTFFISRVVPIDPALSILGDRATEAQLAEVRTKLGLDEPLWKQFAIYVGDAVQGDLGTSIRTKEPVLDEVKRAFPATLELSTLATIIGVLVGVPAGVLAATRPGSLADQIVRLVGLMGYSMPVFWLGLVGLLIFYGKLGWVSGPGRLDPAFDMMLRIRDRAANGPDPARHRACGPVGHVLERLQPHHPACRTAGLYLDGLYQPDDPCPS